MRILNLFSGLALFCMAAVSAHAEDQCGRWVECPEDLSLSPGEYRSYIYRNNSDIEPWAPKETAGSSGSSSLLRVAPSGAGLGATAGAADVMQARSIEAAPQGSFLPEGVAPGDLNVGQLIFEAAPDLSPEQIAQGIEAAELYLKSINYNNPGSKKEALSINDIDPGTGVESGVNGVTFVNR